MATKSVRRALAGRRRSRERGATILESMVASALFLLVLFLTTSALTAGHRTSSEAAALFAAESSVGTALGVILPELRSAGGPLGGSEMSVDDSPEGGPGQRITFRRNVGFDTGTRRISWSPDAVSIWYDARARCLKRREGAGSVVVIATEIDDGVVFGLAGDEVTLAVASTRPVPSDGSRVTVRANERIALRN